MMKRLIIPALITLLPLSAWAIPITYKFSNENNVSNVLNYKKNNKRNFGFNGAITGEWNGSVLSGISGSLLSTDGEVRVNVDGGTLSKDGQGSWMINFVRKNRAYSGTINFSNLLISETALKVWGGSNLSCSKPNGKSCGKKWFGIDAKGPGSTVPGPAPFVVMGIGLAGIFIASKVRKSKI